MKRNQRYAASIFISSEFFMAILLQRNMFITTLFRYPSLVIYYVISGNVTSPRN
jgi:hypothetical protein